MRFFASGGAVLLLMLLLPACLQGRAAMLRRSLRAMLLHRSCGPVSSLSASRHKWPQGLQVSLTDQRRAPTLQPLPIALHRPSANNFFCLNFENEVRKTNYSVLSNQRRVLKESEETGSCCSALLQSCVQKIGHRCYGQDTLKVPDGKCDFFPSPPLSPHWSVWFLYIKNQNKTDICFTSSPSFHFKF